MPVSDETFGRDVGHPPQPSLAAIRTAGTGPRGTAAGVWGENSVRRAARGQCLR
jgi:hypothetical protein